MASKRHTSVHEWILYGSAFIVLMAILSSIHATGILFPYFLDEFGENRAKTAAIQSVFYGVGLGCSIFTGVIIQHYGPRICGIVGAILFSTGLITSSFASSTTHLLITFSGLSGLGGPALLFLSCCQAVTFCFEGRVKLVAISVATSSVGVGAMVYPYLIKVLTESMGVKGTLLIMGGLALNAIPLAGLWSDPKYRSLSKYVEQPIRDGAGRPFVDTASNGKDVPNGKDIINDTPKANHENSEIQNLLTEKSSCINNNANGHTCINDKTHFDSEKRTSKYEDKQLCSRGKSGSQGIVSKFIETVTYTPFSVLICTYACSMPALITFEILYLDVLETNGLSHVNGITLIIIMNGICIPARIFPGLIHKIPRCSSSLGMIIGALLFIVGVLLLTLVSGFAGNFVCCILLGASKGILLGCISVVPLDMLGPSRLSTAMGIIACVYGLLSTALGPLNGLLRDVSGSYNTSIYVFAGSMLLSVMFTCISMVLESRAKARKKTIRK